METRVKRGFSWRTSALAALCWCLPFAAAALLEGALRVSGYGRDLAPVCFEKRGGAGYWVYNEAFLEQYLEVNWEGEELDAPVQKPKGVTYIAVFGESAAHGYPTRDFAFPRCLEALLREQCPATDFEFFNVAYPGVDSHLLLAEARAVAATVRPDAFLVYMGNNEAIGPFGPADAGDGTVRIPRPIEARATIALNQLRLTQLARAWLAPARKRQPSGSPFGPDTPGVSRLYDNFTANLTAICDIAREAHIPVVLCSVATALRDWPPNEAPDKARRPLEWTSCFNEGVALQADSGYAGAAQAFAKALAYFPGDAETHFRLGQCRWALGAFAGAGEAFHAARECDAFVYARARDPINRSIRGIASDRAGQGVFFADVESGVMEAAAQGVPGVDCFLDQCHFSFRGAVAAARTVLPALLEALGREHGTAGTENLDAALKHCGAALAFSRDAFDAECDYSGVVFSYYKRFTGAEMVARMEAFKKAERDRFPERNASVFERAFEWMPRDDYLLSLAYVTALAAEGRLAEALDRARVTAARYPCRNEARLMLTQMLLQNAGAGGNADEPAARVLIAEAADVFASLGARGVRLEELLYTKARILAETHRYDELLVTADELAALSPGRVDAWLFKGRALEHLGRWEEAKSAVGNALERDPCDSAAFDAFRAVAAHAGDAETQRVLWENLVRRFPESPYPKAHLGDILITMKRYNDAVAQYRAALSASTCDTSYLRETLLAAQVDCGYKLLEQQQFADAKPLFEAVLSVRPNAGASMGLAAVLENEGEIAAAGTMLRDTILQFPERAEPYAHYDDLLFRHYGESERNKVWAALRQEHPGLPHVPPDIVAP